MSNHYNDDCTCPSCCYFRKHPQLPRPTPEPMPLPRGRSRMENDEERAGRERAEEDRFDYLHVEGLLRRR